MHSTPPQGEVRPFDTVDPTNSVGPIDYVSPVPLHRLHQRDREVIPPERCLLGPDCLVCQWRREGFLDLRPETRAA